MLNKNVTVGLQNALAVEYQTTFNASEWFINRHDFAHLNASDVNDTNIQICKMRPIYNVF